MKKRIILLLAVLAMLALSACGAKSSPESMDVGDYGYYEMPELEEVEDSYDYKTDSSAGTGDINAIQYDTSNLKLIYTANIGIETENFTADIESIKQSVKTYGGYVSGERTFGTEPTVAGDSGRSSSITVRIPADNYAMFIEATKGVGKNTSLEQWVDDVTDEYFDVESRLSVLNIRKEKLEEFLSSATDMEDIIILNEELSDVIYEIESLSGDKRLLDNKIKYSTITISIRETVKITLTTQKEKTLGERIGESFEDTIIGMVDFFEFMLVLLIGLSPVIIIIAIIVVIVIKARKASKKKKEAKLAEEAAKKALAEAASEEALEETKTE